MSRIFQVTLSQNRMHISPPATLETQSTLRKTNFHFSGDADKIYWSEMNPNVVESGKLLPKSIPGCDMLIDTQIHIILQALQERHMPNMPPLRG